MNPLNRSEPPRSCTQTGVQVPILNVFAALDPSDASNPTRTFSTSTFAGAVQQARRKSRREKAQADRHQT